MRRSMPRVTGGATPQPTIAPAATQATKPAGRDNCSPDSLNGLGSRSPTSERVPTSAPVRPAEDPQLDPPSVASSSATLAENSCPTSLRGHIGRYSQHQETRGDTPAHRRESARILSQLEAHLPRLPIESITAEELQQFLSGVRRRPGLKGRQTVSAFTVAAYHRTLAAFFTHLERTRVLVQSPMRNVPRPKTGHYLVRPFSESQIKELLSQPDPKTFIGLRDITLMTFLLDTGCRISEVLRLTRADVNLERRLVIVMGKGTRERVVPFGEVTLAWLQRYLTKRETDSRTDLVFVNQYGEKLGRTAAAQRIAEYGRRAGLRDVRASPHTFRHTFGVNWLMGNDGYKGDTLSLQRILGHSSPSMTQHYVHLVGEDLGKLHERLSPANRIASPPPSDRRHRIR